MKSWKQGLGWSAGAIGLLLAYRLGYRLKYPLINTLEHPEPLEVDLENATHIDFISQEDYAHRMTHDVIPYIKEKMISGTLTQHHSGIHYKFYRCEEAEKTIVIVHGFNEFQEKYAEMVYYFLQAQFNVLTFDLRGHGNSKESPAVDRIDIHEFSEYIEDLDQLIDSVRGDEDITFPIYLLGHSMGGAIALTYAQSYPDKVAKLILSSPMLNIDTSPLSRPMAHLMSGFARIINLSGHHIPFQREKGIDVRQYYTYNPGLTHCNERAIFYHAMNKELHQKPTDGGTLRWLHVALSQINRMTQRIFLEGMNIPTLIIYAQEDRVVNNNGIYTAATYLPNVHVHYVPESGHEIYQEFDYIVHPYILRILRFLNEQ